MPELISVVAFVSRLRTNTSRAVPLASVTPDTSVPATVVLTNATTRPLSLIDGWMLLPAMPVPAASTRTGAKVPACVSKT